MRFNGRYVTFNPKDPIYINLKLPNGTIESYVCTLPTISVHNLIIGKIYIDVSGKSLNTNKITGEVSEIEWKERGWNGKNACLFNAITKDLEGKPYYKLYGKFNEYVQMIDVTDANAVEELIWKMRPKPKNSDFMF
jgi:hypothetical protein